MIYRVLYILLVFGILMQTASCPVDARPVKKVAKKPSRKAAQKAADTKVIGAVVVAGNNGTRVKIPRNYSLGPTLTREFFGRDFVLRVFARSFSQGEAAYCELLPQEGESFERRFLPTASFEGVDIPLQRRPWGFRGLFAIPPNHSPGISTFEVEPRGGIEDRAYRFPLAVGKAGFSVYRRSLPLGPYSDQDRFKKHPELLERYLREKKSKKELFETKTPDALSGELSHPRDHHHITSSFYAKRMYDRYKIVRGKKKPLPPKISYHEGLDMWGPRGAPVFAVADGTVAMAGEMYYEGNQVIIDHGEGVFTRYMHLDEILVEPGKRIRGGEIIGKVGATGMVTGPHLHAALLIRGVYVDPESILYLPIRN